MFPGTTMLDYLFWMCMGALQVLVLVGACAWLAHFNRAIRWWQLGLLYLCFVSLCLVIAGGFTLAGEYETTAGLYFIGFLGVPVIIVGALLTRLFLFSKKTVTAA